MKLAEGITNIKGSQRRMGFVLRDLYELCRREPTAENDKQLQELLREVTGLVTSRARMRTRIARALQQHPEVVEALAERTVARLSANTLRAVPHNARLAGLEPMTLLDYRKGKAHPDGLYELMTVRKQEAGHRLAAANLIVARLSAEIDLAPERRDRRRERP